MSNRDEVVKGVAAFYDARGRSDLAATLDLVHPDCSFCIMGTDELRPMTTPVSGLKEVRSAAEVLFANWDLSGLRSLSMTIDDDTACVHRAGTVRFLPTDAAIETQWMDKITFRDGKVVEYLQFVDTYLLTRTAGMTIPSDNQAILQKFYDARNRAALDEHLSYVHPQCVFRIVGNEGLGAFTAAADTPEKIREAAIVLFEAWDLSGLRTIDIQASGNTLLVHRKGPVRLIPADISFETELMDKLTFKDGLIIEYLQFVDTHIVTVVMSQAGFAPN